MMFLGRSLHEIGNDIPVPMLNKQQKISVGVFGLGLGSKDEQGVVPEPFQPWLVRPRDVQRSVRAVDYEFLVQRVACFESGVHEAVDDHYTRV